MSVWNGFLYGTSLADEFDADLGDPRRSERLKAVGQSIAEEADASFLETFEEGAEREGFYRLIRNEHVDMDGILSGHRAQTAKRFEHLEEALVIHDTTEFRFPLVDECRREHLHRFSKNYQGFRGHFSLVASADGLRAPLGVVGFRGYVPPTAEDEILEYWNAQFGQLGNLTDRWFVTDQRRGTSPV